MKVLHVLPSLSLKLGGPTQVALNLVRELRAQGVEAEIATTDDNDGNIMSAEDRQISEFTGLPIHFFPVTAIRFRQFIFSLALLKWLWKHCKEYDLIDIHYFFTFSSTVAFIIAKLQKVPYSVRPMGQLTRWSFNYHKARKRIYWFLFDCCMLKNAALIQCTSNDEIEDVKRIETSIKHLNCSLLPLGANSVNLIDQASAKLKKQYGISNDSVVILFMSRLHEKKRPEVLIEAFKKLNDICNVHLIIAGSGAPEYLAKLKQLAEDYQLNNKITFSGFVYGNEKNILLQGSDIFALPSHSENFGIVLAEALSSGLPVVVTNTIQIANDISHAEAGIVIDFADHSLLNALKELALSKDKRNQMSKNARILAKEKYSWDKAAAKLKEAYISTIREYVC